MNELILIITTGVVGLFIVGIGSKMNWSKYNVVETLSYGFMGVGAGVIFYALIWFFRWLLLGGILA